MGMEVPQWGPGANCWYAKPGVGHGGKLVIICNYTILMHCERKQNNIQST